MSFENKRALIEKRDYQLRNKLKRLQLDHRKCLAASNDEFLPVETRNIYGRYLGQLEDEISNCEIALFGKSITNFERRENGVVCPW